MRILNLYLKNINSLAGETQLDFEQSPISEAGVFAITGPNGSGKSTILDAITLALFGETNRFDKPAEYVMTRQMTESAAQIEFALGDDKYRSSWRVQRANNIAGGELSTPEMSLTHLNGDETVLAKSAVGQVSQKTAELIGMDFHKFNKSMILAQGDFAAFLNALDNERMDILEKITGGDLYQEYKQKAQENFQRAKQQLQEIEQDIVATPLMDDAALEAAEHDLADFVEQVESFKVEKQQIQQQLSEFDKVKKIEQKLSALQQQKQDLSKRLEQYQQTLSIAVDNGGAIKLQEQKKALEKQEKDLAANQQTLDNYAKELKLLRQQLDKSGVDSHAEVKIKDVAEQKQNIEVVKTLLAEINQQLPQETALLDSTKKQLEESASALKFTEDWLEENAKDAHLLQEFPEIGKLKSLRAEANAQQAKQNKQSQWTEDTSLEIKKSKETISKTQKLIKELQQRIVAEEQGIKDITEGRTFEQLEELKLEQQLRVNDFLELTDLAKVNAKLGRKSFLSLFRNESEAIQREEKELRDELEIAQLELAKEENIRATLEKAVAHEELLRKMLKVRDRLEDGRPCPLCGSLKHPYVKNPPADNDSKKAFADQRGKVKTIKSRIDSLNFQIKDTLKREKEEDEKDQKLDVIFAQWRTLSNRLNVATRIEIDDVSKMKHMLKDEKQELNNIQSLIKKCGKMHLGIERIKSDIERNEATLKRLQGELGQLQNEWDSRPREMVELEKALENSKAQEAEVAASVAEQLAKIGETLPEPGQEDAFFDSLNERRKEYESRLAKRENLQQAIQPLQEKMQICQEDVDGLNQKLREKQNQLKEEEGAGLHLALIEKQKLIAEKEKQLAEQQQQLDSAQQQYAQNLQQQGFESDKALNQALQDMRHKADIETKARTDEQKLKGLGNELETLQNQLEIAQQTQQAESDEAELLQQQKQCTEKLEIAQQEVSTLQNKLQKHQHQKQKSAKLQAQLEEQQAVMQSAQAEMDLVENENAIPFRRKVQQQMIDDLMSKSNQVLEKISGRYYVRSHHSEQGLALEVEDTLQKNSRRKPKTLSGGESFVVSLALALALAENAHNGHAIESLFIDEGFGNLDAESLYLVMSTLESLKTHGKMVGIISHVEAVKKRVKTQIELIKKPNGHSELKMVG